MVFFVSGLAPASSAAEEKKIRIGVASINVETCTFCPVVTGIEQFEHYGAPFVGEDVLSDRGSDDGTKGFLHEAKEYKYVIVEGVYYPRNPAGGSAGSWVTKEAFDKYVGEMAKRFGEIEGLDGIFLPLHGALAVQGIARPEAELVRRIREVVGDIPIAITMDLHGNEDEELIKVADIVLVGKRYPHYDNDLMGQRAARILIRTIRGSFKPTMAARKPGIIFASVYGGTHQGVPREVMERARRWENRHLDTYVSVFFGFAFSDVPDVGMAVMVVTNDDEALANKIADDMNDFIRKRRDQFEWDIPKTRVGVAEAIKAVQNGEKPVLVADMSDRLGDSTHILRALIEQGASNFVVATIADEQAVETILKHHDIGDKISINIGGHSTNLAGKPVKIKGKVSYIGKFDISYTGVSEPFVVLSFGNNNLVFVTPKRFQVTNPKILIRAGVDLDKFDIIVSKTRVHYRSGFMETGLMKRAIIIDAPGHGPADIGQLKYKNIPKDIYSKFFK